MHLTSGRVQGMDFLPGLILRGSRTGKASDRGWAKMARNGSSSLVLRTRSRQSGRCADRPQRPVGALELFSVSVALMGDHRRLADPLIGLAQGNTGLLRQPDQTLPRPVRRPGVGWERHRFDCTVLSTMTREKSEGLAAPVRVAVAKLCWISATSFSSPIRWCQRVSEERSTRLAPEELLAAEQLKAWTSRPQR